jgi:hypothetical protein
VNDPKLINPPAQIIPEEWRRKYEARSAAELAKDVNELFAWKRIAEPEKDLIRKDILKLQERYNWALCAAVLSLVFTLLLCAVWLLS